MINDERKHHLAFIKPCFPALPCVSLLFTFHTAPFPVCVRVCTSTGEVDRARAIFTHGAQFDNPKRAPDYWKAWHDFEVAHGNEDTFRDMLRVKRSILTVFANETFYDMAASEAPIASDQETLAKEAAKAAQQGGRGHNLPPPQQARADPMAMAEADALEAAASGGGAGGVAFGGGVKRKAASEGELDALERQKQLIAAAAAHGAMAAQQLKSNPEEIDLDDEASEEEEEEAANGAKAEKGAVAGLVQKAVPAGVFGATLAAHMAADAAKK